MTPTDGTNTKVYFLSLTEGTDQGVSGKGLLLKRTYMDQRPYRGSSVQIRPGCPYPWTGVSVPVDRTRTGYVQGREC